MTNKQLQIILTIVMGLFIVLGFAIGYQIHTHLRSFGVTFVTIKDVIACYLVPTIIMFAIGYGLVGYAETKIKTKR